jgi:hypothetical protein
MDKVAKEIVTAIVENLKDRRGFRQTFDEIDEDVQIEINTSLQKIVEKILKNN